MRGRIFSNRISAGLSCLSPPAATYWMLFLMKVKVILPKYKGALLALVLVRVFVRVCVCAQCRLLIGCQRSRRTFFWVLRIDNLLFSCKDNDALVSLSKICKDTKHSIIIYLFEINRVVICPNVEKMSKTQPNKRESWVEYRQRVFRGHKDVATRPDLRLVVVLPLPVSLFVQISPLSLFIIITGEWGYGF